MQKNKILVVDDEPDIVNLVSKFLNLENFETIPCSNGKEAIDIIETNTNEIIMVLLDIMMPGKSGYTVLEEIKNNEQSKHILVVLFTVKSFKEDIQKGKKLGADGYLTKPFSGTDLVNYVRNLLKKHYPELEFA